MEKWKQSLARLPTSVCSREGKFAVITLCLKIVFKGVARQQHRDSRMQRCFVHPNSAQLLAGVKEKSSRRSTMLRRQAVLLDPNHCWQRGGLTPPSQASGRVPPRRLLVIEMEIQEVMLQREEVSRSPCQSVCLFILRCFITVTFCSH